MRELHARNIIHLDIKPSNILLFEDEIVKLSDYGFAKIMESEFYKDGKMAGSPAYMAPEIYEQKSYSFSADVYSLGVTFIHILLGELPSK